MTRYILDTDICIYWLKGNENIEKSIIRNGLENIFITVITECELFYGAYKSTNREKNLEIIATLKKKIKTLHTGHNVSEIYGMIKAELESKGKTLDDADLLIGSIALSNNACLVTNNTEHFKRITGHKTENWK